MRREKSGGGEIHHSDKSKERFVILVRVSACVKHSVTAEIISPVYS